MDIQQRNNFKFGNRALEEEVRDSNFKAYYRPAIRDSNFKQGGIQDSILINQFWGKYVN